MKKLTFVIFFMKGVSATHYILAANEICSWDTLFYTTAPFENLQFFVISSGLKMY